ncbi:putative RTXE-like, partial [Homarus americanus]
CYAIEDHDSVKCSKPKEYKICSKCTSREHTWTHCIAPLKCLNCDGPHSIMSMNCPKRKEKLKEAQQKATKTSVSPYKAVLPIGTPTPAVTARTYRDVVMVGTPTPAVTARTYRDVVMVGTPTPAVTMVPAATTDSTVLLNARDRYLHDRPDFPTFYSRNSATTPVIAITNGRCFHNYLFEQGPVISSDHPPIIMTISATLIIIPAPPRRIAKQTDWELFNEKATAELEAKDMTILQTIDNQPVNKIDDEINTWCEAIGTAYQEATPLKRNRTLPQQTPELIALTNQF